MTGLWAKAAADGDASGPHKSPTATATTTTRRAVRKLPPGNWYERGRMYQIGAQPLSLYVRLPAVRGGHLDDRETGAFPGERVYSGSVDVRYLLLDATERPDSLAVVFSSAQQPGTPPRYRWHKLLRDLPCHRLFVLDDQGPCDPLPGPSWYLGRHRPAGFADSIHELLERTIGELGVDRERGATVGSSMGGWAALYFGAGLRAGLAIAGEPQTLLG